MTDRRVSLKPRWRLLLALAFSGLLLAVAEGFARLFLPLPLYPYGSDAFNQLPGLLVAHPTRGYTLAPGFSGTIERGDEVIHVATNSLGLREREIATEDRGRRILAVGDSFTVGFGVGREEAWPAQLERLLEGSEEGAGDVRVINAGISGYSLRQIRLTAEELIGRLAPDLVIAGVYPGAAWRLGNPYVLHGGRLVTRRIAEGMKEVDEGYLFSLVESEALRRWHLWSAERFRFGYYLLHAAVVLERRFSDGGDEEAADVEARLRPFLGELDELIASCRRRAVPLVVLLVNPQAEDGSFTAAEKQLNAVVAGHLEGRGVPYVDPLLALEVAAAGEPTMRLGDDHHWSARAHRQVAEQLAEDVGRRVPRAGGEDPGSPSLGP